MTHERSLSTAFLNGLKCKCPSCGDGKIFDGYIKVNHSCEACGLELHHQRADDAPPYFTMLIVLHIVVSGILAVEQIYSPPNWIQLAIWMPTATLLSFLFLRPIKGALIGIQWAKEMHGFNSETDGYTAQQID
jgi:uncharacterized protein (DUF983 family)